ncbi:MAG: hypothetical protein INQ03_10295 [Candidatus Heimdallarchaeota archaeon]|nr:hypothetical protein [Candidatus Heimdallarchaeota archaeon]
MKYRLLVSIALALVILSQAVYLEETEPLLPHLLFDDNIEVYYTDLDLNISDGNGASWNYIPSYNILLNNSYSQSLEVEFRIIHNGTDLMYSLEYNDATLSMNNDFVVLIMDVDEDGYWDMSFENNGNIFDWQTISLSTNSMIQDGYANGSAIPVYNDASSGGVNNAQVGSTYYAGDSKYFVEASQELNSDDDPYDINLEIGDSTLFRLAVYVDGYDSDDIYSMTPIMLSIESEAIVTITESILDDLSDQTDSETTNAETVTVISNHTYTETTTITSVITECNTTTESTIETVTEISQITEISTQITSILETIEETITITTSGTQIVTSVIEQTNIVESTEVLTSAKSELKIGLDIFIVGLAIPVILKRLR